MRIQRYDGQRELWDNFVLSHPEGSVSQLSASFLLAERSQGARNRSLTMLADGGELAGIFPILELTHRELRLIRVRELLCGGPLLKPGLPRAAHQQALAAFVGEAKANAAELGADRVTISYPASAGGLLAIERYGYLPVKEFGFRELNSVGQFLDLRQEEERLFRNLDSKCRNMIRRAQKSGIAISPLTSRERWLTCHDLNVRTLGSAGYSMESLETIWDEFISRGVAAAVAAELDGRILSVAVASRLNQAAYYWLGFNEQPHSVPGANNYALWEAILLCKREGVCWFNVGSLEFSANQKQKNIAAFKAQFGGLPTYTLSGVWERRPGKRWIIEWAASGAARGRRGLSVLPPRVARRAAWLRRDTKH
ncbi:MAG: GNAT family N-acetyltransferase [Terriglobia bacterium]